jgi:hypothetical protein
MTHASSRWAVGIGVALSGLAGCGNGQSSSNHETSECPANQTLCPYQDEQGVTACTDTTSDGWNCGACEHSCQDPTPLCQGSTCVAWTPQMVAVSSGMAQCPGGPNMVIVQGTSLTAAFCTNDCGGNSDCSAGTQCLTDSNSGQTCEVPCSAGPCANGMVCSSSSNPTFPPVPICSPM